MTTTTKLIGRLRNPKCESYDVGATGVATDLVDWDMLDEAADLLEALEVAQEDRNEALEADAATERAYFVMKGVHG